MPPEELLDVNGVRLCVQSFGEPADPAVLLIHGAAASMLWWETRLCERLAACGRFVIRYDSRDTGRSTSYPPGRPGYALTDLAGDALGILDALGVRRAHVVGRSMAGAVALVLGVDHPDRVASLTLVGTSTGDPGLPPMHPDVAARMCEPAEPGRVVEHIVELIAAYAGGPHVDRAAVRELATADVARTVDVESALTNHFLIDFDGPRGGGFADLRLPVLVVHGDRDPVFPLPHAEALRRTIPGARLLVLAGVGHELPERSWDEFVRAVVAHTSR